MYVHLPRCYLLIVVVWIITEALFSLLLCGTLGLYFIILIQSPSLSLTVNKGTSKSGTILNVSSGHREEAPI
jgi:hypothetical protein